MPRQKYEGDIYIISSETTKDMVEAAVAARVSRVYNKIRDFEEIDELCGQQAGKTVAVVDDTPISARTLVNLLNSKEVGEVVVFYDPLKALEAIPNHIPPFGTVFLDYKMPRMTGLELANKLRVGENT